MKYASFLFTFLLSVLAGILFLVFYLKAVLTFARYNSYGYDNDFDFFFETIFTTPVILSLLVAAIASLAYRIMAIVWIAKNKIIQSGEKAIWIIGFVLFGFVTAIVFLVLAKSRKLISNEKEDLQ